MNSKDEFLDKKIYDTKILDIKEDFDDVKTYILEKPTDLTYMEGASFRVAIPGFLDGPRPDRKLIHHLSINSLNALDEYISFTTRFSIRKSDFKKELGKKKVGDYLQIFDIENNMTLRREDRPIYLLSMGIGMSTMKPLIYSFIKDPSRIRNLTSINVSREGSRLFYHDIMKLNQDNFHQVWIEGRRKFFEDLNERNLDESIIYIVGSNEFLLDTIHRLNELGVKDEDIHLDMNKKKHDLMVMAAKRHDFY
ncbi:MAG: hypothetical protein Q4D88_01865 [Anaerococcus sp.]|nr:hypothetical protein [Anaerococcus sp.]